MSNYYLKDSRFNLHRPRQKRWLGRLISLNKFIRHHSGINDKVNNRHAIVILFAICICIIGFFYILF